MLQRKYNTTSFSSGNSPSFSRNSPFSLRNSPFSSRTSPFSSRKSQSTGWRTPCSQVDVELLVGEVDRLQDVLEGQLHFRKHGPHQIVVVASQVLVGLCVDRNLRSRHLLTKHKTLVKETLVEETKWKKAWWKRSWLGETLVEKTFVGQTLVEETPVEETLVEESLVEETLDATFQKIAAARSYCCTSTCTWCPSRTAVA